MDKNKILNKAKVGLFLKKNVTFITSILFSLKFQWEESIPTADVDGRTMRLNPDWFCKLTLDEQMGLMQHEAWHVAFDHITRGMSLNQEVYNQACDHLINLMLVDAGEKIPSGGLCDPKYRGWSERQIYDDLMKDHNPKDPPKSGGDIKRPSKDQAKKTKQHIDRIVSTAVVKAQMSKDAGSVPGAIGRHVDSLFNPKLAWNTILQNYLTEKRKEDFTWASPNRRYMPDFYLPTMDGEGLESINFYTDSSGSVSDRDFTRYCSEMQEVINLMNPTKVTVAEFDTQLRPPKVLQEGDGLDKVTFSGYGGTCIRGCLDHIHKENPTISIIFTDGYFSQYVPDGFRSEVIWVIVGNSSFDYPVGKVIHMDP